MLFTTAHHIGLLVYSIHLTLELCYVRTFFFIFNVMLALVYKWFI